MLQTELDVSQARRTIIRFIKEKVEMSQTDGVVFELEGDVNSAVTAYLSVEALGTRRVVALLMPDLRIVGERDLADAKTIGEELCLDVKEFDIAPIHKALMKNLQENRTAEENLRERIRMSLLYYHANTLNRLVVGTCGRADVLLGNFTKYGDGGVDILPIADMQQKDIRKLGEVLGINRRVIAKRERARPARGRAAIMEAGVDKDSVDRVFQLGIERGLDAATLALQSGISGAKVEAILSRNETSSHKRQTPEICRLG